MPLRTAPPALIGASCALALALVGLASPEAEAQVCGAYSQACCAGGKCNKGLQCRGSCQPTHGRDGEKALGKRSVRVVLVNQTAFTLRRLVGSASHGKWSVQPPNYLQPFDYAQWQTDSNGLATGTTAHVDFDIWGPKDGKMLNVGKVKISWNNPFSGGNDYAQSATPGFAIDRRGGSGNHTVVFFFLRAAAQRDYGCADLWIANHLAAKPGDALNEFDETVGFFTTAVKRSGIQGWTYTGCGAEAEGLVVRYAEHSTDGFWTIDVWLTKLRVGTLDGMYGVPRGQGRAMRIEVKPGRAAHATLTNQAAKRPRRNDRIRLKGPVYVDHGHFLEIHPDEPIAITNR